MFVEAGRAVSAAQILLTAALGLGSSFIGSFLCFVIWVHFELDQHWEERKYTHHAKKLETNERLAKKRLKL